MSVAVILAAGLGTRMKSAAPKAAQRIGGRAMLTHLTMAAAGMFDRLVVVVGPDMPGLAALAAPHEVVVQAERLGTGHAALMAASAFGDDLVGIFYADNPLLTPATMEALRTRAAAGDAGLVVLGMRPAVAGAYGRLVMEDGFLARIVEAAEATDDELAIGLCNAGGFIAAAADLRRWLAALRPANAKGEYYLTDIVAAARAEGARVAVHEAPAEECLGVNSRAELAAAEAVFQARARTAALSAGVAMLAPETVFFSADTELAADVVIGPYVVFGPGVRIGAGAEIKPFSHLEDCVVGESATIGPYARLRPGADIGAGAHVGNFCEIKAATLGPGAKVNHLSYIGDAKIGAGTNIGAGTITCNYDGKAKHRTTIGTDAFIGSNTALVAPVTVGDRARVAAGSVITDDVPDDALAFGRARQVVKVNQS
jgi:bifunctional UDP-N-acetylglucosamine pyrophosphorylase/glucosamine-1-phosphate N-acetyltransferase